MRGARYPLPPRGRRSFRGLECRFEGHFGGFHPTEPPARARRPGNARVPPALIGGGLTGPICGRDTSVPRTPCPRAFARGVPGENPTAHMPRNEGPFAAPASEPESGE